MLLALCANSWDSVQEVRSIKFSVRICSLDTATYDYVAGLGTGNIYFENCIGNETELGFCTLTPANCAHTNDAGVFCHACELMLTKSIEIGEVITYSVCRFLFIRL